MTVYELTLRFNASTDEQAMQDARRIEEAVRFPLGQPSIAVTVERLERVLVTRMDGTES